MPFRITDRHIDNYHRDGFVIFESLIPVSLLRELRVSAEQARAIAHEKHGRQAQRLQPVQKFDVDLTPYRKLSDLPELNHAVDKLFGPGFRYGWSDEARTETMHAILFEPGDKPWCTQWHRDWRDNVPGMSVARWEAVQNDLHYFNQVNCALYEDTCTWVVPGSHLRKDLAAEIERFPERPIPGPTIPENASNDEIELICLRYTQSMPGAKQAHLDAGDFMLYRNALWHIGNYVPYKKRATIHDGIWTQKFNEWFRGWPKREDGQGGFVNPNVNTPEYKAIQERKAEPVGAA